MIRGLALGLGLGLGLGFRSFFTGDPHTDSLTGKQRVTEIQHNSNTSSRGSDVLLSGQRYFLRCKCLHLHRP